MNDGEAIAELLSTLVAIPSVNPAFDPQGARGPGEAAIAAHLAAAFGRLGAQVQTEDVEPGRPNVYVVLPGDAGEWDAIDVHTDTVGVTGMPEPDGTQKAVAVHIFPENQRGAAEGFRPWDQRPNSTMTNATVAQTVKGTDGQNILVKYKDGEKKVVVPPDTPVVTFVAGDKSAPGTPYHDNVALWAARSGMVGVTMNYRLAPEHRWPSGAEDVGADDKFDMSASDKDPIDGRPVESLLTS